MDEGATSRPGTDSAWVGDAGNVAVQSRSGHFLQLARKDSRDPWEGRKGARAPTRSTLFNFQLSSAVAAVCRTCRTTLILYRDTKRVDLYHLLTLSVTCIWKEIRFIFVNASDQANTTPSLAGERQGSVLEILCLLNSSICNIRA